MTKRLYRELVAKTEGRAREIEIVIWKWSVPPFTSFHYFARALMGSAQTDSNLEPISKSPAHASTPRRACECRIVCMLRAPQSRQSGSLWPVLTPTARDSAHLGAVRRRRSPCVRQVHGDDHRLELHPNGLVAYARDLEIGSSISFTGSASITRQELAGHSS